MPREKNIESREDSKAAKTALHVCARVIVPATKMNPEQGTRSGFTVGPKLPGGVGVSGEWDAARISPPKHTPGPEHLRIMPQ